MPDSKNIDIINASPTKDFFIYMLVKDLDLNRAISDLVDNSIDGAKRLRKNNDYSNLFVNIEVSRDGFKISDNCGGIPIEVARNYAFRFGRVVGTPATDYSVGRFGVGMKRAIFKLGKLFKVESTTQNSKFLVEQDVQKWAEEVDSWDFHFSNREDEYSPGRTEDIGTTITVTDLYAGVADEFSLENYQIRLRNELTADHQVSIEKGLKITLNGTQLKSSPIKLVVSQYIQPAYKELSREGGALRIRLYAGITKTPDPQGKLDPSKAGWDIFCNDRLILKADKSYLTGWGTENSNPSFHNDYARFKGVVFFESQQPDLLPWNTTKSGIDSDLPVYRAVRQEMTNIMKPAVKFLKDVSKEKRNSDDTSPTPLEEIINAASLESLANFTNESVFQFAPESLPAQDQEKMKKIQYSKPEEDILRVQKILGVKTLTEVGQKTFEYYMLMECDNQ
jgi:Histidine kinase-, DNA gyrase B-, and HSP90-like ATPase